MEPVKNFFNKIINDNVVQFLLMIAFFAFGIFFIERLKAVKFDPVIFLGVIICIIIAFILGRSLKDSDSIEIKIIKEDKTFFITEQLYVLRNKKLPAKDREEAFDELIKLDCLTNSDYKQIFDYIEDRFPLEGPNKQKLTNSVIEKMKQMQQKARDT